MNQNNGEEKRTARDRLREQREREKTSERRLRTLKVAGVMVAVLAVAALAGVLIANQDDDGGDGGGPAAAPITQGKSKAPVTLTVYEDFRCPACAQFENTFRDTIHELQEAGQLRTEYRIVTIIDGNMGGEGSAKAANAAACARDQGRFEEYHDVLFRNQPPEQNDDFGDTKRLIELAGKVKGLDNAAFRKCVRNTTHGDWVERSNSGFLDSGHDSTPTVLLDGEDIYGGQQLTPEKLRSLVAERA